MYAKIAVLRRKVDETGNSSGTVTIGFFDRRGILQLEVPQVSGDLFPKDVSMGKSLVFNYPAKVQEIKK